MTEKVVSIGRSHGLAIDQIGILESLIEETLTGTIKANEFVGILEERLDIEGDPLIDLAAEVNAEIFIPQRDQALRSNQREEMGASRDEILSEIEDKPSIQARPQMRTVPPVAKAGDFIDNEHKEAAHGFIANTLAGNAAAPAQKTSIELRPKEPEKPKGYASDPYREPLS